MEIHSGQRVRLRGETHYLTVDDAWETADGVRLYLIGSDGTLIRRDVPRAQVHQLDVLSEDGFGARRLSWLGSGPAGCEQRPSDRLYCCEL